MKKSYLIILIILSGYYSYPQEISDGEKDSLINIISLEDSLDPFTLNIYNALQKIIDYKIYEAIPSLETMIWQRNELMQYSYLEALSELNAPSTCQMVLLYYDSIDNRINLSTLSKLVLKVRANKFLLKCKDFSKIEFLFQFFDNNDLDNQALDHLSALQQLKEVIRNSPEYKQRSRSILEAAVTNEQDEDNRFYAMYYLEQLYGIETYPFMKRMFDEDTSYSNQALIVDYAEKYRDSELMNLIKEALYYEYPTGIRTTIFSVLLNNYSCPIDYKYLQDYLHLETDSTAYHLLELSLSVHEILNPNTTTTIISMNDSLSSYIFQCSSLGWIDTTLMNYFLPIVESAKSYLQNVDSASCAKQLNILKQKADYEFNDSLNVTESFITDNGRIFINAYTQHILDRLPAVSEELNYNIKLLNSTGTLLTGGSLQYYEGAWKDAINNEDGTFLVNTSQAQVSLRMTYEYGTQTLSNVSLANGNVAVFQTVNAAVELRNSSGTLMDAGTVQYYAGAWREFGSTTNGIAYKELLPNNYSFRMTYANSSNDKQQNIGTNPTVTFQTVNAAVELRNSSGTLMDAGTVQYYAGAWREFGSTTNGIAYKELLPNNYSFRMTYANAGNDKQQNIGTDPTVTFQTVNAAVELRNSSGTLMDAGTVQYYAGAWREFGTTTNGTAYKELLPNNYSFRMTYANAGNDKQQNIGTNPTVTFQTVNAAVELRNSSGTLMDAGTVQYYAGAWREFGSTTNGIAYKELLPNNYSFRMTYEYVSNDKQQNIGTSNPVVFSTTACRVTVKNTESQPLDNADIKYYAGAWRTFGITVGGEAVKELLPANLSFRASYNGSQKDKVQNTATNSIVEFVFP